MNANEIAGQIQEQMEVVCSQGMHVGTVDHLEGTDRIKLTRKDSSDQTHHFVPLSMVERVDTKVHLNRPCDRVKKTWENE